MIRIFAAPPAPRDLLFVATFDRHDRAEISRHPELMRAIHEAEPGAWAGIIAAHRQAQRMALETHTAHLLPDDDGMRRQALHDLQTAADALAALTDTLGNENVPAPLTRLTVPGVNDVLTSTPAVLPADPCDDPGTP